uniref:SLM2 protein n=1 Tax=Silene latifolia TaxID=37657 RepID=Q41353_SILLA|nr:SLM2 [Silene latifolia subsp. alba]
MGRGKIEIKRIENSTNRQVTYSKRRNGIIKKAGEITVLCEAKVSLIIFSNNGKMHAYHSPETAVEDILDQYHKISGKRLWDAKHENLSNEIDRVKKENDNMQIELRHLKGEDITSLPYPDLMRLEDALENGLVGVREKQMEMYKLHKKNHKMLEDENNQLAYMLHKQEMDGNMREMEAGVCSNPSDRDYHYQNPIPPYGFRVQPMQPNLQDRM